MAKAKFKASSPNLDSLEQVFSFLWVTLALIGFMERAIMLSGLELLNAKILELAEVRVRARCRVITQK